MRKAMVAQSPEDRNKAKLVECLKAGCQVMKWVDPGVAMVRSKDDPAVLYRVTRTTNPASGAITETCTCRAMDGGQAGSYHKAVVRWHTADGRKFTNGVIPCGHILTARFDRQWLAADQPMRAVLLASVPGLEAALAAHAYYHLEA